MRRSRDYVHASTELDQPEDDRSELSQPPFQQDYGPEREKCWLVRMRSGNLYWWEAQLDTRTGMVTLVRSRSWRSLSDGRNHRSVWSTLGACLRFLAEPQAWGLYRHGESARRRSYERYMDLLEHLMADGWLPYQTDRDGHIWALQRSRPRGRGPGAAGPAGRPSRA